MDFSIRPEETEDDRAFVTAMNARLVDVIDAPAHSRSDILSFQESFTATAWQDDIGAHATLIAATPDGARLGYVHAREGRDEITDEKCGYVALLAVTAAAEGNGVAQALVTEAEAWAKKMGYTLIALDVFASNKRGLQFYDKAGFRPETIRVVKKL